MKRILFSLHLFVWGAVVNHAATSSNIVVNSNFEQPVVVSENYEMPSVGQWSFFVCKENGSSAMVTQPSGGYSGKCVQMELLNLLPNDVWSSSLYQDFQNLRPCKYELVFRVRSLNAGNTALNVSILNRNTNHILSALSESGFHYSDNRWEPILAYLDFSTCSLEELASVRLSLHFSQSGIYSIDEVSLRPIYEVPFVSGAKTQYMTDYFSFDLPAHEGFVSSWNNVFSTSQNTANFGKVGSENTNNVTMRYTIYPEKGAQPIQGIRSLFVEVSAVNGNPSYEIKLETPQMAPDAIGKRVRLSFWAKGETGVPANNRFSLVPRFLSSSATTVLLSDEWTRFSYDYNLTSMVSPEYPFFRFQFDKVNNYHLDGLMLEYVEIPDPPLHVDHSDVQLLPRFCVEEGSVFIENKQGLVISFMSIGGINCNKTQREPNTERISLLPGSYIAYWSDADGQRKSYKLLIHK